MSAFDWSNPTVQLVIERASRLDRKISVDDCEKSKTLRDVALFYASNYAGNFDFMIKMRGVVDNFKRLSNGQSAGVINCLLSEYRYQQDQARNLIERRTLVLPQAELPNLPAEIAAANKKARWDAIDQRLDAAANKATGAYTQAMTEDFTAAQVAIEQQLATAEPITPACANGTYTIVLDETGDYRTIRLTDAPDTMNKCAGTQIASYLNGADNESNYIGFAFVTAGKLGMWKKFNHDGKLSKALAILLQADKEKQIDLGHAYALESGNCFVCGRKLTVPASIHRGMGPICASKY